MACALAREFGTRTATAIALAAAGHPCAPWAVPPPEPAWRNCRHLLEPDERIAFASFAQPGRPNLTLTIQSAASSSPRETPLLDENGGPSGKSVAIGLAVAGGVVLLSLVIIYLVALNHAAHAP
jgi:hypothetical protein